MNERDRKRREGLMDLAREMRDVWWCGTEPPDNLDGLARDRWVQVADAMARCGLVGSPRLDCAMAAAAAAARIDEAVRARDRCRDRLEDVPGWVEPPKGIAAALRDPVTAVAAEVSARL